MDLDGLLSSPMRVACPAPILSGTEKRLHSAVERLFISMAGLPISYPNQSLHVSALFVSLQTGNVYTEMGLLG